MQPAVRFAHHIRGLIRQLVHRIGQSRVRSRIPLRILARITIPVAALVVGLGAGIWIGRASAPNNTAKPITQHSSAQSALTPTTQPQNGTSTSETSKIEAAYTYGKDLIDIDQKTGRLTKQQAGKARTKLDELHTFRKNLASSAAADAAAARSQKRQEVRNWAKANDISSRYFTRLY